MLDMNITLPDGSIRKLKEGSTGLDLAMDIGPGLAKAAIAVTVNGDQKDLCDPIEGDAKVSIITVDSSEGLEIMRHTLTAQVLARAVKNLYPDTKLAIGPTIINGFYYDFEFAKPISPDDLQKIEKEMRKIIDIKSSIRKTLHSKEDAIKVFKDKGELYKESIIQESDQEDNFQLYFQDDNEFVDLCRGPHLPNLKHIGSFKLTKLAGAYWKGDSNNKMLTRIYGTAWKNDKDLNAYLHSIEEAEKRDHRKLGKEMNLFHFQEEAPGMVFWHPNGWTIYRLLQEFIRNKLQKYDYKEINTPQVVDRKLWEASGHWDKYRENMFITEIDEEHANEKRTNALKPMNCPCHVQVYNQGLKSYRDLPLRYAEFGSCHRYEASGTMHGLMRVRGFTQDDGHIFCTEEQIESETKLFIQLLSDIYKDLGFEKFDIKLSTRPEIRVGSDEVWDKAENALESAIKKLDLPYEVEEGDGAFYGPKLDFVLTDAIGREWQCGTFQADFNLPDRLEAEFIGEDGQKHTPVMIHRAVLGSFERFIGVLIENYSGKLPFWLAPVQVAVATIVSDVDDYAAEVINSLENAGIRCHSDFRNEKISYKVREHSAAKVPVIMALGKREKESSTVSIRRIGSDKTESMDLSEALKVLSDENSNSR
ncbi:threonine--tRNA ligase [Gammaproteobacteria bacterium]|nr:threonine--tRNA ligase [Gammaproteobacteria bacterium]MDB2503088.1 threonine--tRNA ligase [Gammaproteobacteria bacterium]MDB2704784.1 threonine--tRNA ligase [Gammaproteobacteria bacterium]